MWSRKSFNKKKQRGKRTEEREEEAMEAPQQQKLERNKQ